MLIDLSGCLPQNGFGGANWGIETRAREEMSYDGGIFAVLANHFSIRILVGVVRRTWGEMAGSSKSLDTLSITPASLGIVILFSTMLL